MKSTSIAAYEASKEYQPTARWDILSLLGERPKWMTSEQVAEKIVGANSGIRTRLKELEDMGLVESRDVGGSTKNQLASVSYKATTLGLTVHQADNEGRWLLKIASQNRSFIEGERAKALADVKSHWDEEVRRHMRESTSSLAIKLSTDQREMNF